MLTETPSSLDSAVALTAEDVQALRNKQPLLSVWRVVGAQLVMGATLAVLFWFAVGRSAALSVAYGALAVVLPSALFARGMTSRLTSSSPVAAVSGFLVWELVKIGSTVAMLFTADTWIENVRWPAMLVGFVVTMKVYWVVLGFGRVFYPKIKT